MNQKELFRLLPFIGLMLSPLLCLGQDDRFLPDVEGYRIDRESYVMIWDSALRLPKLVAYEVTRDELQRYDCGGARFHADPDLNEFSESAYEESSELGFEKGHLIPKSHGSWDEVSCLHTSYYSNIVPQRRGLNNGAWRTLDEHIADLALKHGSAYVNVAVLPFFDGSLLKGVPIPIGFWKSVVFQEDGVWYKESYLISQFSECDNEAATKVEKLRNLRCDDYLFQLLFGWNLIRSTNEKPIHTEAFLEGIEDDAKSYFLQIYASDDVLFHFPTVEEIYGRKGSDLLLAAIRKFSRACSLEGLRPKRSDLVIPQMGLCSAYLSFFDYEVWPLPHLPPLDKEKLNNGQTSD